MKERKEERERRRGVWMIKGDETGEERKMEMKMKRKKKREREGGVGDETNV